MGYDFDLGDPAGREVYLLHHHDQLVVSIPAARARRELLDELAGLADVFEDWSGYGPEACEEPGP